MSGTRWLLELAGETVPAPSAAAVYADLIAAAGNTAAGLQRALANVRQVEAEALAMAAREADPERRAGAETFVDLARAAAAMLEASLADVRAAGGFEGSA